MDFIALAKPKTIKLSIDALHEANRSLVKNSGRLGSKIHSLIGQNLLNVAKLEALLCQQNESVQ